MDSEDLVNGGGWISDESSFYGDADIQAQCAEHIQHARDLSYRPSSLVVTAEKAAKSTGRTTPSSASPATVAFNGVHMPDARLAWENAWQQNESIDAFLSRKPPDDPLTTTDDGWLWVGSPTCTQLPAQPRANSGLDLITFTQRGSALLKAFKEVPNPQLAEDLLALAISTSVTYGKWMLFPSAADLAQFWRLVATATAQGRLGPTSKTAVLNPNETETVICVYTCDFSDRNDVYRVLKALVDIGLCAASGQPIYYKCDAYTYLGINSENEYKLRASLYSSRAILRDKKAICIS
ncbi:hypothetical protein BST61_g10408 [Cercospora zeina]